MYFDKKSVKKILSFSEVNEKAEYYESIAKIGLYTGLGVAIFGIILSYLGYSGSGILLGLVGLIGGLVFGFKIDRKGKNLKEDRKTWLEFYNKCKAYGIDDRNIASSGNFERMKMIAKDLGIHYSDEEVLKELLSQIHKVETGQTERQIEERQRAEKIRREKQEREREQADKEMVKDSQKYSDLSAKGKREAFLDEMITEYQEKADKLKDHADNLNWWHDRGVRAVEKNYKETNPYAMGGLADGLAGGAAGLAMFVKTEQENAEKRVAKQQAYADIQPALDIINSTKDHVLSARSTEIGFVSQLMHVQSQERLALEQQINTNDLNRFIDFTSVFIKAVSENLVEFNVSAKASQPLCIYENCAVCDGTIKVIVPYADGNTYECLLVINAMDAISNSRNTPLKGYIYTEDSIDVDKIDHEKIRFEAYKTFLIEPWQSTKFINRSKEIDELHSKAVLEAGNVYLKLPAKV